MDRRTSLGGRLSLSTSNLASPLAESTQVNGSSLQPKFPWGGKMSPGRSTAAPNSQSILKKTAAPKVMLSPIRRIDPRIYTDVQSNGLTSRIVKYHENSAKLNRSMSVGNLYNKPGQYPVVHLKKNDVYVKPRRNPSISVVRIAPPDRSLYQNSVRSSILRNGSLLPSIDVARPYEKDFRDNRPIVPPAENDVNPTRSVLDALKEISRKRINSDDVDCNDSIKKCCKENDDDPRRHLRLSLTNNASQSQQVSVITKRQREITTTAESNTSSPEKSTAILKRPCTKNNDILSSLSSSISIGTPKRKLQDFQGRPPIGRYSPSSQNLAPPNAKQHCNDRNFASTSSAANNVYDYPPDQLTPIPATPADENKPSMVAKKSEKAPAPPTKPRLTLFNKDYDTTPVIRQPSEEARLPEEEGIAGISFIKPKKSSPHLTGRNALVERVQSSKLSLMLSCLSGDFNDSDDEVDSKIKEKPSAPTPTLSSLTTTSNSSLIVTSVGSTASTTTISTTSLTSSATSISAPSIVSGSMQTTVSSAPAPAFSFGLKPQISANSTDSKTGTSEAAKTSDLTSQPSFGFGIAAATSTNDTKSSAATMTTSTATPAPAFGSTFAVPSFGSSQPNSNLNIPASSPSTSSPSVTTTSAPVTSVSTGFEFGQQKSATTFPSITSLSQPASTAASNTSLFSFGSPKTQQTNTTSAASSTTITPASTSISFPTTTIPPGLSFGNPAPAFGMAASSKSQTAPMFSFGSPATTTPATLAVAISTPSSNISFGSSLTKPVAVFGSSVASTTTSSNSSIATQQQPAPAFGSMGTSAFGSAGVADANLPKFGETAKPAGSFTFPGSTTNTVLKFGDSQQSTANVASGLFGSISTNAPATTTTSTASFNFGSAMGNKPVSSTPSFNFNATGNNSATPLFGSTTAASTTAGSTVSTFGTAVQQPNQLTQAAPNQSVPFGFGAGNQQPQQPPSGPFSFGGNAAPSSTPFGFGNQPAVNATQPQTTKSFSFSGSSGASAFTAVSNSKPASGGFSFNVTGAASSESKSVFGAIPTSQAVKPFSFSNTSNNPAQQQPTPLFGSSSTNSANPPAFGASSINNANPQAFGTSTANTANPPAFGTSTTNTANPPAFGAPAMTPGKLFSFGAAPATNNASAGNAVTSNMFSNSSLNNNSTATPLFPAANNTTQSPFGAISTTGKTTPAFNFSATGPGTNNNNNSSTNMPFNFGATSPLQGSANKTFTVSAAAPSDNIFGSKPPSFAFPSAGSNGVLANSLAPAATANPFHPTKSGSEPPKTIQGREIRTATRRLKPK